MRSTLSGLPVALRASAAGLVLGAVFLAPAWAQPPNNPSGKAQQTITVTEDKDKTPAEKGPEAAPATPGAPAAAAPAGKVTRTGDKIVTNRDPFVQQPAGEAVVRQPQNKKKVKVDAPPTKPAEADKAKTDATAKKDAAAAKAAAVPPPAVTVTGIVTATGGNRAILTAPNQSYIVKAGDKLGDYKVTSIDKKTVTFSFQDKAFPIKMADDMATNPAPGASKGGGGGKKK